MSIRIRVETLGVNVPIKFGAIQTVNTSTDADIYEGPYEVTPKVDAQTIPTAQKYMAKNLTVTEIPRYDVSNTAGGTTVYIAKELEEYGQI